MLWGEELCCCVVSRWGVHRDRDGQTHTETERQRDREDGQTQRDRERTCGFCGLESRQQHSHYCCELHPTEKEFGWRFSFLFFFLSFFLLGLFGFWLFLLHLPAFRSVWVFSFAGKWSIPFFLSSTWFQIFFLFFFFFFVFAAGVRNNVLGFFFFCLWWVSGESSLQSFDPILGVKFEHLVYVKFVCEMHTQLWCFVGNFAPSHLLYHKPLNHPLASSVAELNPSLPVRYGAAGVGLEEFCRRGDPWSKSPCRNGRTAETSS